MSLPADSLWVKSEGEGPIVAAAIHAGHEMREELLPLLALDEPTRAREEDPYTDYWIKIAPSWIAFNRSRFEVDLNRKREEAVYLTPDMSWGLQVWKQKPDRKMIARSLEEYDAFYRELHQMLSRIANRHKHFVVFELHAYDHRRNGPHSAREDPALNPDVNVGTGSMDRTRCGAIVDRFMQDLRTLDFPGRQLDVRENVKFRGRQFAQWIHTNFRNSACVLAIEFKKFFMDEWTGICDIEQVEAIRMALQSTLPGMLEELNAMS